MLVNCLLIIAPNPTYWHRFVTRCLEQSADISPMIAILLNSPQGLIEEPRRLFCAASEMKAFRRSDKIRCWSSQPSTAFHSNDLFVSRRRPSTHSPMKDVFTPSPTNLRRCITVFSSRAFADAGETPYGLLLLYGMPKSPGLVSEMRSRRDEADEKGEEMMDRLNLQQWMTLFPNLLLIHSVVKANVRQTVNYKVIRIYLQKRHFAHRLTSIIPIPIPMLYSELALCRLKISLNAAQLPWYLWLER
ncbi:hypothetical protein C8J56DRAFT_1176604 [Mycena floridula]|nr:hypothetical protein C8J56DRAFT_1176604 [Mycena floridula]